MAKKCGCVPNQYTCGDCERKENEKVWSTMSEKDKQYDRHFAPHESRALDDAMSSHSNNECCSCHINPPCGYCTSQSEETP